MKPTVAALSVLIAGMPAFSQADPITVPLLDDEVSFRVQVTMFGQTNYFLVDTGTSATALDTRYRERLGAPVRQWGGQDFYRSPNLVLGNTPLTVEEVFCADLNMFRLITGEPCDGILGMDFLKDHLVQLDFERSLISIGGHLPEQTKKNARAVPLTVANKQHFTISAVLNQKVTLNLMVDSSDSSTVSLNQADWEKVFPPGDDSPMYKVLFAGISKQPTASRMARLRSLEIAGQTYSNVICPLSIFSNAPSAIGIAFLRRHLVALDFTNGMLYLRPRKKFNTDDEHDMSGLHLLRRNETTFVHSVDEGSPAVLAGVQAGDVLLSIKGRKTSDLKIKEIREILKSTPGTKVVLEIQRGGKVVEINFVLKRFL